MWGQAKDVYTHREVLQKKYECVEKVTRYTGSKHSSIVLKAGFTFGTLVDKNPKLIFHVFPVANMKEAINLLKKAHYCFCNTCRSKVISMTIADGVAPEWTKKWMEAMKEHGTVRE